MHKLFQYFSYQSYLRDFYEFRKSENSFFSYRYMGRKLDLDAGFLVKVLQGKKHLAAKSISAVAKFCGLAGKEAEYFEMLVLYAKAKSNKDIKLYFEKLISLKGLDAEEIESSQYVFYQKWYHSAIRSLMGYYKFAGDYRELAGMLSPAITTAEAKESIKLLEKLGIIGKQPEGHYTLTSKIITTGKKWKSAAIRNFQEETIELARQSLDRHPPELRDISTVTLAVSHKDLEEIKERAREFRQSIMQMKNANDQTDCVYQVNLQIVPMTRIGRGKS